MGPVQLTRDEVRLKLSREVDKLRDIGVCDECALYVVSDRHNFHTGRLRTLLEMGVDNG